MRTLLLLSLLVHSLDAVQLKKIRQSPLLVNKDAVAVESVESVESGAEAGECSDPSMMTGQTYNEKLLKKFKMEAKSPDTRWKMKKALASLTEEDLATCGSCDGIPSAAERARLASKPVKYNLKKIFYINPAFATGRRNRISHRLNATASEYPIERFPGVTKAGATNKAIKEFTRKGVQSYIYGPSVGVSSPYAVNDGKGTKACYLSHARLLKSIYESDPTGEDVYAIFEDDANPPSGWPARALKLLETHVPEDWDIFKFGFFHGGKGQHPITKCVKESRADQYGIQAYFVRPKSIPKILDQLASQPLYDVDGALHSAARQIKKTDPVTGKEVFSTKGLVLYISAGPIVKHDNRGSLRTSFDEEVEEEALTDEPEDRTAMEKAWPEIAKEWDNAVEEERQQFGLHAKVVEESEA